MRGHTSIWFFSGLLLLSYGVLILATGLWELGHPLVHPPVLSYLHAPIWWGALMLVMGLFYTIRFRHHR
ncbi:MAG TPA: hypothetical protein VHU89_14070 [Acidobacteriaceae bacterium]|jgi:uncharacterized membrane protein HdeD (DUF308 family)|nr:hypothetical protein [Acidobacteriaceae bacterium]